MQKRQMALVHCFAVLLGLALLFVGRATSQANSEYPKGYTPAAKIDNVALAFHGPTTPSFRTATIKAFSESRFYFESNKQKTMVAVDQADSLFLIFTNYKKGQLSGRMPSTAKSEIRTGRLYIRWYLDFTYGATVLMARKMEIQPAIVASGVKPTKFGMMILLRRLDSHESLGLEVNPKDLSPIGPLIYTKQGHDPVEIGEACPDPTYKICLYETSLGSINPIEVIYNFSFN
ncbi:hypothetical protein [Deinococcus yavapaiensis]|nr:hypothetical protein [Deinococcus yavapaiensis]